MTVGCICTCGQCVWLIQVMLLTYRASLCLLCVWLAADNWDANTFCQARAQLFILTGFLHDQVELTETARGFVGSTAHSVASSPRGHYNAAQIPQPPAGRPIANTVRQDPHSQASHRAECMHSMAGIPSGCFSTERASAFHLCLLVLD